MSNTVMIDRYRVIKKYREAGLNEDQAELYTEALVIAVNDQVATKQDIAAVRSELAVVKSELKQAIVEESRKTLLWMAGLMGGMMTFFKFIG